VQGSPVSEQRLGDLLVGASSRRGFLARVGRLLVSVSGGGLVAASLRAEKADAFHFCGHLYTTGSCPHPTGLPRVDALGFPLRATDGRPVDDLGRLIDSLGRPVSEGGAILRAPDGEALPSAPRSRTCDVAAERFNFKPHVDGAWYRCCDGHIRKLIDCCGSVNTRINGDAALAGYCYSGRRVFCVQYYDSKIPC
jgi:hypothetical protein